MAGKAGQQVAPDDPRRACSHKHCGIGKVLLPQREQLGAHRSRQPRPVEQPEDDRNAEVDKNRAPGHRQRRRECHPEGQLGEGPHHLDEPLDHVVDPATEIAGDAAQGDADQETDEDPQQADGQRDPRPVDDPRKQVAAEAIGPEEEERAALRRAYKVEIAVQEAPELVLVPTAEKAQRLDLGGVLRVPPLHGGQVEFHAVAVDERPDEPAFVDQLDRLRGRINAFRIPGVEVVRGDHLAHQGGCIDQEQDHAGNERDPVALELPPHDLPLRSAVKLLLL